MKKWITMLQDGLAQMSRFCVVVVVVVFFGGGA